MRSTIIVSVGLFLAVIAASIFYFSDLGKEHKDATKPLTHLPEETLLIATFKNDETTDNIFKDFEVFDALLGFRQKEELDKLKRRLLRNNSLSVHLLDADVFVSLHQVGNSIESLYTIPTVQPVPLDELSTLLSSMTDEYTVNKRDTLGHVLYALTPDNPDSTLYTSYLSDAFYVSSSGQLLAEVLDKSRAKLGQEQIDYFFEKTNRNVPLSIYYPHQQTEVIAKQFLRNIPGGVIQQFLGLGGQSAWNINYKQDALMLTGESELADTDNNYIALFARQNKTTQRLYNYYPANTAMYMEYSVSNLPQFRNDLERLLSKRDNHKQIQDQFETIRRDNPDLLDGIDRVLGHEFSIIELNNRNYIGFVSIRDTDRLHQIIEDMAQPIGDSVYRFRNSNLLYAHYGDALKPFQRPYFTIVDDVIVMSNYQSTLSDYLRSWDRKDLLTGTLGFKNFERLQGNEANVTFFLQTSNARNTLLNVLNPEYAKNFRNTDNYGYRDFYSWSAQLSGNNGNFISSIYAIYKSSTTLGATADWTYQFNHRLITQPYVFEHSDTSQFIMAQEQDHTVHAIHPNGSKMWSAVFHGRVVGDITQLSDRSIVLVTERSRLYRFDTEGHTLPNFSLGMPHPPSGTPTILTVGGEQTIFVPANNKLMAYALDGRKLNAWEDVNIDGKILDGIHLSEDKVVVGSSTGKLYFFDQGGNTVKEMNVPEQVQVNESLALIQKDGQDIFVATDTSGTCYQFSFEDGIESFQLPKLSGKHRVFYTNIAGSSAPEMVVIDGSQLYVYDMTDSLRQMYHYAFTRDITTRPLFFPISRQQYQLGVASQATNLIYLFEDNGTVANGFPIEALPLFYYGRINYNSSNYLLCTRRNHTLYAYRQ